MGGPARRTAVLTAAALTVVAGCTFLLLSSSHPLEGSRRPDLSVQSLDGVPLRLTTPYARRHVIVVFTPACPHCRTELTHLARLWPDLGGLDIIGVSLGSVLRTRMLRDSLALPFPVFVDPSGSLPDQLVFSRVPSMFLVNEFDVVERVYAGARSFHEDSVLLTRFSRRGTSGGPGDRSIGAMGSGCLRPFYGGCRFAHTGRSFRPLSRRSSPAGGADRPSVLSAVA